MGEGREHGLRLRDPVAGPTGAAFTHAPRLGDLTGRRLGLIDNSKMNSDRMLDEIARLFEERYRLSSVTRHRKAHSGMTVTPEAAEELAGRCDVVIAGIGD
jgi:hypothetical protein